jgi:hypothetical protein
MTWRRVSARMYLAGRIGNRAIDLRLSLPSPRTLAIDFTPIGSRPA